MKSIKWNLLFFISLMFILAACTSGNGTSEGEIYNPESFELTFPNAVGEQVSLAPNGKTLYVYFTGIG